MKKLVVLLSVALVLAIAFAVVLMKDANRLQNEVVDLQIERNNLRERLRPFEARRDASMKVSEELVVEAQHVKSFSFKPAMVPGTLAGTWRASGKGYGGVGDSINQFRLADPSDDIKAQSEYGATSGKFFIKVTSKGTHTFFFDNSGLFRTTPRRVFIEAEYKPD